MIRALFESPSPPDSIAAKVFASNEFYKAIFPEEFRTILTNTPIRYRAWLSRELSTDREFAVTSDAGQAPGVVIGDNLQADQAAADAGPNDNVATLYHNWAQEGPNTSDDESSIGDSSGWEPEDAMSMCGEDLSKRGVACSASGLQNLALKSKGQSRVFWRMAGILSSAVTFSDEVLNSFCGVNILAQPFILLVEFVEGQYLAAAISAAAIGAGILASMLVAGPIGELLGTALAVFLPFLPAIFDVKEPGPANNVTEILQFAFFGDRSITGNEGCNKNLVAAGQTPNCTIM